MDSLPQGPYNHYGYQWADPYYYPQLKQLAQEQRRFATQAETLLWNALRGKALAGHKFRRQHIISKYVTDFVCLKKRLIIEIDGSVHQLPENPESDAVRADNLNALGFRVLRFTNGEIAGQLERVLLQIEAQLTELPAQPSSPDHDGLASIH